jgi:hypothetical protein
MADEIKEFREKFFAACKNTDIETPQLLSTLDVAKLTSPGIFAAHVDANYLEKPEHLWNEGFFEQCLHESKEVFSLNRLDHLLTVRNYLRKNGVKGFKPTIQEKNREPEMINSQFQPAENLKASFQKIESDPSQAQIALRFELYDINKNSNYLKDAIKWAESQAPQLFSAYETSAFRKAISDNEKDWSVDYFDIQTEYLSSNFSKERYLHLIDVREYLRIKGVEGFAPFPREKTVSSIEAQKSNHAEPKASNPASPPHSPPASKSDSLSQALRIALMAGGAIAALLMLVFSMRR